MHDSIAGWEGGRGTVIIKPTLKCNAGCDYCCVDKVMDDALSLDDIRRIYQSMADYFETIPSKIVQINFIWHGGEPFLMGPGYYDEIDRLGKDIFGQSRKDVQIKHSVQSNMLLYDTGRWKDTISRVFRGRVSSSLDLYGGYRKLKGGTEEEYNRLWLERAEQARRDGIEPFAICLLTANNIGKAEEIYYFFNKRKILLKYNYIFSLGHNTRDEMLIDFTDYSRALIKVWQIWFMSPKARIRVMPLVDLLAGMMLGASYKCPWRSWCSVGMLGIQPNGDTFNCPEFADLYSFNPDQNYMYGNILQDSFADILASPNRQFLNHRAIATPQACRQCQWFNICQGVCQRDALIYRGDIRERSPLCEGYRMLFEEMVRTINQYSYPEITNWLNGIDSLYYLKWYM